VASPGNTPDLNVPALENGGSAPLQKLWLLMLTRNLRLIAGAVAVVMFAGGVAFDVALLKHEPTWVIAVSNGLVALLAGSLVFTLLSFGRAQRRQIMERLAAMNEVNHHIRNALQSLAFTAGALKGTKDGDTISEAIQRIQWALHEVLPKVEPKYEPFEGSARQASERNLLPRDPQAR
jgi:hypothetical protein